MERYKVSIIIPVYNAEKYIFQCLDSIISQTYRELEIILVDDGSKDYSLDICRQFEQRDKRISVLLNKHNLGVSKAKNKALDLVKGEYVMFLDADDYVKEDFVEQMVNALNSADIVACGYMKVGAEIKQFHLSEQGKLDKDTFYFHTLCSNLIGVYCTNKLFRRELIENIRFCEDLSIGEDMLFLAQYLRLCNNFQYIPQCLYVYRTNEHSVMRISYSTRKFNKSLLNNLTAALEMQTIMQKEEDIIQQYVSYRIIRICVWCMFQMIVCREYHAHIGASLKINIQNHKNKVRRFRYGTSSQKLMYRLIGICPIAAYYVGLLYFTLLPQNISKYTV